MLSRRKIVAGGALGCVSAIFSAGFAAGAAASTPVKLSLPGAGTAGSIWRPLMERNHAEALAKLQPQWVGGDPGQIQVQLLSGALDIAAYGTIGAAESLAHGADIVIFGPGLNNHGRWIVRGDSPYHSPHDLIGKRLASQPENSETYLQARIAAALVGIDLKHDMQVIFGPPTANLALFQRGDVDGVILLEPTATRLVAAGAREIARVGDMWHRATGESATPFLVGQTAQRHWFDANRDTARKIAALFQQANEDIKKRPELISEFHLEMGVPTSERAAIELLPSRMNDVYTTVWGKDVFATMQKQLQAAAKLGILPATPTQKFYATA